MKYLLGTLSEEERARLEERYFSDDTLFEEIEIAEDELIDRYVRGELSKDDADRFKATMASSPRIAERVEFASIWKDKLAAIPLDQQVVRQPVKSDREPVSWWQRLFGPFDARTPSLAYAAVALILIVGAIALVAGWLRVREQSRQLAAQQAALEQRQRELDRQAADLKNQRDQQANRTPQPTPTETPKQIEQPSPGPQSVFAIALTAGTQRSSSGGGNVFKVSQEIKSIRLDLAIPDSSYPYYRVKVLSEGKQVASASRLRLQRSGATLSFVVSANQLPPGDYVVKVDGLTSSGVSQSVADYQFGIRR